MAGIHRELPMDLDEFTPLFCPVYLLVKANDFLVRVYLLDVSGFPAMMAFNLVPIASPAIRQGLPGIFELLFV